MGRRGRRLTADSLLDTAEHSWELIWLDGRNGRDWQDAQAAAEERFNWLLPEADDVIGERDGAEARGAVLLKQAG